MPRHRRTYRRRYAARSTRFRKYRKRKRGRRTRAPTNRVLAHRIKNVSKRLVSARKMFYTVAQNVLVENSGTFTTLGAIAASNGSLTDIPYSGAINPNTGLVYPGYQMRERDEINCAVGSISIRMSVHASPLEGVSTQHFWIALVKCTTGVGSNLGIVIPNPGNVWDPSDTDLPGSTSILPMWRLFKPRPGHEELSKTFKVVKAWTGAVQPQGGALQHIVDYAGLGQENNATGTQNDFIPAAGVVPPAITTLMPGSLNYTATIPSFKNFNYTHGMKGKKLVFDAVTSRDCENVKYFLLAIGNNAVGSGLGYRVNATIRTVFYSV